MSLPIPRYLLQELKRQNISPKRVKILPWEPGRPAGQAFNRSHWQRSVRGGNVELFYRPKDLRFRRTAMLETLRHELGHLQADQLVERDVARMLRPGGKRSRRLMRADKLLTKLTVRGAETIPPKMLAESDAEYEAMRRAPKHRRTWLMQRHVFKGQADKYAPYIGEQGLGSPWNKKYRTLRRYQRFLQHIDAKGRAGTLTGPWKKMWETRHKKYGPSGRRRR